MRLAHVGNSAHSTENNSHNILKKQFNTSPPPPQKKKARKSFRFKSKIKEI